MKPWFAIATVIVCVLSGCGKTQEKKTEPVAYRLKWLYNASVAGSLYAKTNGLFQKEGLVVKIKEGGPERNAITELELGHAQFGVASADQVIRALSKGSPIVVIAQLFQQNPLQWIYRPNQTDIQSPRDLKGKKIGITFGGNDEAIMKALLASHDIPKDAVSLFSVRYDFTPFYNGQVELWPVYQNTQGVVIEDKMESAGETIRFFNPAHAGVHFVANSIITTKRMLQERPELVTRFTSVLLQGWKEALDVKNREQAVMAISQFDKNTPIEMIEKQLAATRTLIQPSKGRNIGSIDGRAWDQTEKILLEQGLIPRSVNIMGSLHDLSSHE